MKKLVAFVLALVCVLGLVACSSNGNEDSKEQTEINNNRTTENTDVTAPTSTENDAEYGCLQALVDTYGFPIYFKDLEGMNLITVEISEDSANREWKSNDGIIVHENLKWGIADNHLIISGDWKEEYVINVDTWQVVSALDGKEYEIVIYDKNGDVVFSTPS